MNGKISFFNDLIYCGCYREPITCTAQVPEIFYLLGGFLKGFNPFC